jgi:hypothetical protein
MTKIVRKMELMREQTSDTYRVQEEMMTGKFAPQFNQVPTPYNIAPQQYNTVQPQYNTAQPQYNPTQYNQVPQYNAPRGDRVGYRGGGREEEALEEAEDQWYVTTINNQDTMQENVHFHLRHVCIVTHQIMIQKIVQHYWGRSRKREIRTIRMFSGFLQKQGMTEEIST